MLTLFLFQAIQKPSNTCPQEPPEVVQVSDQSSRRKSTCVAGSEAVIFSNLKKVLIALRVMLPQKPKVFELRKSRGA